MTSSARSIGARLAVTALVGLAAAACGQHVADTNGFGTSAGSGVASPATVNVSNLPPASPYVVPSPPAGSGVEGEVFGDPACLHATPPCGLPSGPLEADVVALDASGAAVGHVHSVTTGDFLLALPPGHYTLEAHPVVTGATCQALVVDVASGVYQTVSLHCTLTG